MSWRSSTPVCAQLNLIDTFNFHYLHYCVCLLTENEFFFDEADSSLYLYYNASAGTAPPADLVVEATNLQDYIQILGTPPTRGGERVAVTDVSIKGITIQDAAATYLEPHGMPSGGGKSQFQPR